MPSLARPCHRPGCTANAVLRSNFCVGHRDVIKRIRQQDRDRDRLSSAARGYDSRWRRHRLRFLADNPLCVHCLRDGHEAPATIVDHVIPHRMDQALFWDTANHQALCKRHHDRKTGTELTGWYKLMYPLDLPVPTCPAVIVAGPPAAGKSTYAHTHAEPGDIIIDLDDIKARSGPHLDTALIERNRMIRTMAPPAGATLWFVVMAPEPAERSFWARALGQREAVLLFVDEAECTRRIVSDPSRVNRGTLHQQIESVRRWHCRFSSWRGDRGGEGEKSSAAAAKTVCRRAAHIPSGFA